MKLYSHPLSLFSAKVRIALAEKELACEIEDVSFDPARGYQPKHPAVLAHNPKGQVPVLISGELALYDSTLILEYIEDLKPQPALYPRGAEARARCRLLELEADDLAFAPVYTLIARRYARTAGVPEDPSEWPRVEAELARHCQRLNGQLDGRPFLCGEFSVADIGHFLVAYYALGFRLSPFARLPDLQGWFARVGARPAVAREVLHVQDAARNLERTAAARPAALNA